MKTKSGAWIRNAGTLAVIVLVFTMGLSPAFAKERKHGKELSIQKKDGVIIRGELIAVRKNSLLLDSLNSTDNSIAIGDIGAITIINKSHLLSGAGIGLLSGAGLGIVIGFASGTDVPDSPWLAPVAFTAGEKALLAGLALGVIGGVVGGIVGAIGGTDETIKIKETDDPNKITKLLEKLRALSLYPDEK